MFNVTWLGFFATFGRLPSVACTDVDVPTSIVPKERAARSLRANCDAIIIQSSSEFLIPRCGDG